MKAKTLALALAADAPTLPRKSNGQLVVLPDDKCATGEDKQKKKKKLE